MVDPVVVCLSRSGEETAWRVADILGASVHGRMERVDRAHAYFTNALDILGVYPADPGRG